MMLVGVSWQWSRSTSSENDAEDNDGNCGDEGDGRCVSHCAGTVKRKVR